MAVWVRAFVDLGYGRLYEAKLCFNILKQVLLQLIRGNATSYLKLQKCFMSQEISPIYIKLYKTIFILEFVCFNEKVRHCIVLLC